MLNNSKYNSFFTKMKQLSDKQNQLGEYPQVVFLNVENMMKHGVFTSSGINKFIADNYNLSVVELTNKYNRDVLPALNTKRMEHGDKIKEPKSVATFRVQRAELSNLLLSIFGQDFDSYFYNKSETDNLDAWNKALYEINIKANLFKDDSLLNDTILLSSTLQDRYFKGFTNYDLDSCKPEILFLSLYSQLGYQSGLDDIDLDKLACLESILSKPVVSKQDGKKVINEDKIKLLVLMSKVANSQVYSVKTLAQHTDIRKELKEKDILINSLLSGKSLNGAEAGLIAQLQAENKDLRNRLKILGDTVTKQSNETIEQLKALYEENQTLKKQNEGMRAALEMDDIDAAEVFAKDNDKSVVLDSDTVNKLLSNSMG